MSATTDFDCDLLLLAAVSQEFEALFAAALELGKADQRHATLFDSRLVQISRRESRIVVAQIGIGSKRAYEQSNRIIERVQPNRVLLAGLSGGLNPKFKTGDVIQATQVSTDEPRTLRLNAVTTISDVQPGTAFSSVDLASSPEVKDRLHRQTQADVVDMESFAVASVCQDQAVPLDILRVVCDDSRTTLRPETLRFLKPDGSLAISQITSQLLRKPSLLPHLVHLGRLSRLALSALRKTTAAWLKQNQLVS